MKDLTISVFLPVRKHSQRVLQKNTRRFAKYEGGLLELKLKQLTALDEVDEIVISTNDPVCTAISENFQRQNSKIRIEQRPDHLGNSVTDLTELIKHAYDVCRFENILWTHVTSPFFDDHLYSEVIKTFSELKSSNFDSLVTGKKFKEFLLDPLSKKIINNHTGNQWPRTQDLDQLFEIDNAVFLCPRFHFLAGDRIGKTPFLFESDAISSLDIDEEEDFIIAEAVYEKVKNKSNSRWV